MVPSELMSGMDCSCEVENDMFFFINTLVDRHDKTCSKINHLLFMTHASRVSLNTPSNTSTMPQRVATQMCCAHVHFRKFKWFIRLF